MLLQPGDKGGQVQNALPGQHTVVVAMAQVARLVPHIVEMHVLDPGDGVGVEMSTRN